MAEDKTVLSAAQADAELQRLPGWRRDGAVIHKDFVMANFRDITAFLKHLVDTIATRNHHPDFSLNTGTRTIAVSVTTHSAKALTRSDLDFAAALNAWTPGR